MRDLGRRDGPLKDRLWPRSRVPDPVSYTAVLPIGESTVAFLSGLLAGERAERRTRKRRRLLVGLLPPRSAGAAVVPRRRPGGAGGRRQPAQHEHRRPLP